MSPENVRPELPTDPTLELQSGAVYWTLVLGNRIAWGLSGPHRIRSCPPSRPQVADFSTKNPDPPRSRLAPPFLSNETRCPVRPHLHGHGQLQKIPGSRRDIVRSPRATPCPRRVLMALRRRPPSSPSRAWLRSSRSPPPPSRSCKSNWPPEKPPTAPSSSTPWLNPSPRASSRSSAAINSSSSSSPNPPPSSKPANSP